MVVTGIQFTPPPVEPQENTGVTPYQQTPSLTVGMPTEVADSDESDTLLPRQVLLGALRDGRLRVRSCITIILATEGQHVIAEAAEFNEFGFGDNLSEALIDLQRAIAELFFALEREQYRLGPDLKNVWASLQEKIIKRP
ncbi:MAG: hypothetical protein HY686_05580 [Chloroflexi bacterium]|nr:hypothetical protein [Chloroflexota bacterium]